MKRTAYIFTLTYTAVSLCLSSAAEAQLYLQHYRSDKPGVELDMDVLNDLQPPQERIDAPPAAPVPKVETAPPIDTAPRAPHQPLFAVPIPIPAPQPQQPPAPKAAPDMAAPQQPAVRRPYNPYLTAPAVPAPQPVPSRLPPQMMPPVMEEAEETVAVPSLPHRKPVTAPPVAMPPVAAPPVTAAPAPAVPVPQKPVLSYPPAAVEKAPVPRFDRPVLPQDSTLTVPQRTAPPAASDPETAVLKPLPKPPIETLPEEIISEEEIAGMAAEEQPEKALSAEERAAGIDNTGSTVPLPPRKPVETIAEDTPVAPAAPENTQNIALPAPKPFKRPSLIVTDQQPPAQAQRAVLKQAEVTMPVTTTEYAQIAENMETVPVEVAMAPPKPVYAPKAAAAADVTLEFDRTSESLSPAARAALQKVIAQMNADENAKLQVRAFATGEDGSKSAARSKSLTRATEVRSFLMDNGIKPTRIIVRAMGQETDRKPLDRIDLIFLK